MGLATKLNHFSAHVQQSEDFSTRYYSFNVLRLIIILVLGGLLMILELGLEPLVTCIKKRRKHRKPTYATIEWQMNTTLQLQRLAHEELGLRTWSRAAKNVPTTQFGELLGTLDVSDESHPLLVRPTESDKTHPTRSTDGGFIDEHDKSQSYVIQQACTESNNSISQPKEDFSTEHTEINSARAVSTNLTRGPSQEMTSS